MGLSIQCLSFDWGNHESTDDPPEILAITGVTPKKEKSCLADRCSYYISTSTQATSVSISSQYFYDR